MIRARSAPAVLAGLVVLLVGGMLCVRSGDPAIAAPEIDAARQARFRGDVDAVDAALGALADALDAALQHARTGASRTRSGNMPPAEELVAAAAAVEAASQTADGLGRALRALTGTAASVAPSADVPTTPAASADLLLVAGQLRTSAEAAADFFKNRRATESVTALLAEAVAALDRNDPETALQRLRGAVRPFARLAAWERPPETFGFWLETISELHSAAEAIAVASLAGDPGALAVAAARYAAAAESARGADNALALALSEGASATTINALRRLADLLAETISARAALAPLRGRE